LAQPGQVGACNADVQKESRLSRPMPARIVEAAAVSSGEQAARPKSTMLRDH
jgi:hypothetical protein